ncbi:MAG TPA: PaaI family thioesterase [Alphaproteobacteria bacterium]
MPPMTPREFSERTRQSTPLVALLAFDVEALGPGTARVRVPFRPEFTRSGGTVSGPVLMALADYSVYGALMNLIEQAELAVTATLNINFLRRPPARDVIAEAQLIRCGKRLAYGEVMLFSDGDAEPVAHVTVTYSIPPQSVQPVLKKGLQTGA